MLSNLTKGTQWQKPVGDLHVESKITHVDKDWDVSVLYKKSYDLPILTKVIKFSGQAQKGTQGLHVVQKPPKPPRFRCVADRATM